MTRLMCVTALDGYGLVHVFWVTDVVRPMVDEVLPLDDMAEANRQVECGRACGETVVQVAQ